MLKTQVKLGRKTADPVKSMNILSNLDDEFKTKEFIEQADKLHCLGRISSHNYLKWLMKFNKIERVSNGVYQKIKSNII